MKFSNKFKKIITLGLGLGLGLGLALLTGCHEEEKAQMQTDVTTFCESFKTLDFDTMYALSINQTKYFNEIYVPDAEESELIFKIMGDNLTYEVEDCEIDGKEALVNAKVTNIDMDRLMTDVLDEYFRLCEENPDNIDNINLVDIIEERAKDPDAPKREANSVFNFEKQDGKWLLDDNVMIYDDITGGYMTYYFRVNMAAATTVPEE